MFSSVRKVMAAICLSVSVFLCGGVYATWQFASKPAIGTSASLNVGMNEFIFTPEEMPDEEVTVVQRLSNVLNKKYTTESVDDSLDYLINETIQVYWNNDPSQDPFVGSMDKTYAAQIAELFEDVLMDTNVSFILKNQDLNSDGYNEIAMYSTSDPLDNTSSSYKGIVRVFVTVFTPIIDTYGKVTGYRMVCESLLGYCSEIYYSPQNRVPSFSTDTWKDAVGYETGSWWNVQAVEIENHQSLPFNSYNLKYRSYDTIIMGDTLSQVLAHQL